MMQHQQQQQQQQQQPFPRPHPCASPCPSAQPVPYPVHVLVPIASNPVTVQPTQPKPIVSEATTQQTIVFNPIEFLSNLMRDYNSTSKTSLDSSNQFPTNKSDSASATNGTVRSKKISPFSYL